jgi:hypothetical protein
MQVSGHLRTPATLGPVPIEKDVGVGPRASVDGFGQDTSLLRLPRIEPRTVHYLA